MLKVCRPLIQLIRHHGKDVQQSTPRHLICFKDWTSEMVMEILNSAMSLKRCSPNLHGFQMNTLCGFKILTLQEVNQPVLNMAVAKAATLLGASYVNVVDQIVWDQDYMGRVFSKMADAIFVSTTTHKCVQRFAKHSTVPVMCMFSRTHASIQALSIIMALLEAKGDMKGLTIGYLGPPKQVLNSLLLLSPMLGANIQFKCCCDKFPQSPLLYKMSEDMCSETKTGMKTCTKREEVFENAYLVIAGPTSKKKDIAKTAFKINAHDLEQSKGDWMFIHTCPRGEEVDDNLFFHKNSRTYNMFDNFHYIAAALIASAVKNHSFC